MVVDGLLLVPRSNSADGAKMAFATACEAIPFADSGADVRTYVRFLVLGLHLVFVSRR